VAKGEQFKLIRNKLKMVVSGQGSHKSNRELLEGHVLKWAEVDRAVRAAERADQQEPGWGFKQMFLARLETFIGEIQRAQGRRATGKGQVYATINRRLETGKGLVDTTVAALEEVRREYQRDLQGRRKQLEVINVTLRVARESGATVITKAIWQEAERRLAAR
jgi:hypothetical protein